MSTASMGTDHAQHPLEDRLQLGNGVKIPQLGLGVFQIPGDDVQRVVEEAIEVGYRHFDTAAAYNNEAGVGAAVRASGVPREQLFLTTKLRNGEQGYEAALSAYQGSLERLGVDHLDLYLIHWPNPAAGLWQDSWRALDHLAATEAVRAVGVSNFLTHHVRELLALGGTAPAVNQIERHPSFAQQDLVEVCGEHGITVQAYSPLGQGADLDAAVVTELAAAHGATPAQVVLRWHVQHGHVVIPKTTSRKRLVENLDVGGFTLSDQQMAQIDALDTGQRIGNDPDSFALSQIR